MFARNPGVEQLLEGCSLHTRHIACPCTDLKKRLGVGPEPDSSCSYSSTATLGDALSLSLPSTLALAGVSDRDVSTRPRLSPPKGKQNNKGREGGTLIEVGGVRWRRTGAVERCRPRESRIET